MNDKAQLETGVPVPSDKIELEDGIPVPKKYDRYPFDDMQPGQSFLFPDDVGESHIQSAVSHARKKHPDWEFTSRKMSIMVGATETKRTRVWRTK